MPGESTTRRRKTSGPREVADAWTINNGQTQKTAISHVERSYPGTQVTVSEGHNWPPPKKADLVDRGGPFFTSRSYVQSPATMPRTELKSVDKFGHRHFFTGPILANAARTSDATMFVYPPALNSSNSKLDEMGATAIARCKPTNSPSDLSTAVLELVKEGLPSLVGSQTWRNRAETLRKRGAGEYLNVQFGWMPLVSEVTAFGHTLRNMDKILSQYERDAGRVVRRRYSFPIERESTSTVMFTNVRPWTAIANDATVKNLALGNVTRHRVVTRRRWFAGAFTYHLPSGYDSRNALASFAAKADVLFSTNLTPETLWNIGPWSWAVDWFSNAGDVISNITDFGTQGLVMRYGYLMEHTIVKDIYTHLPVGPQAGPTCAPVILVTETKIRRPANPFGFGVSWDGLSPFQLSIAAALGITKGR